MRGWKSAVVAASSLCLSGCADTELNKNTLDLASTTDDLVTAQIYHNLANFIDSDLAYPSQIVFDNGTASTTDTLQANYASPITTAVQATLSSSGSLQRSFGSQTLGLQGQGSRTQLWSYEPVTDAFRAQRLMALYHYAVDKTYPISDKYPKIFQTVNHSDPQCLLGSKNKKQAEIYGTVLSKEEALKQTNSTLLQLNDRKRSLIQQISSLDNRTLLSDTDRKTLLDLIAQLTAVEAKINLATQIAATFGNGVASQGPISVDTSVSRCINSVAATGGPSMQADTLSYSTMKEDPYYMQGPQCVLCATPHGSYINPLLRAQWLHWKSLPGASPNHKPDNFVRGDTLLGTYGHYELYAAQKYEVNAPEFAIFVLAASTQSDTGGSSSGGSSGGGGGGSGGASSGNKKQSGTTTTLELGPASGGSL